MPILVIEKTIEADVSRLLSAKSESKTNVSLLANVSPRFSEAQSNHDSNHFRNELPESVYSFS